MTEQAAYEASSNTGAGVEELWEIWNFLETPVLFKREPGKQVCW